MSDMRRLLASGAIFAYKLDNLSEAKKQYDVTGNPVQIESPWGPALNFDGASYIECTCGNVSLVLQNADDITILSAFKWINNGAVTPGIFQVGNQLGLRIQETSNGVRARYVDTAASNFTPTSNGLVEGKWQIGGFILDSDAQTLTAYCDRSLGSVATAGLPPQAFGANIFQIGREWGGQGMEGGISWVAIWDRTLSDKEIESFQVGDPF